MSRVIRVGVLLKGLRGTTGNVGEYVDEKIP